LLHACTPAKHRDDEIEHVKTMHACQDPQQIAKDLRQASGAGSSN
jgi:hypothetical protein